MAQTPSVGTAALWLSAGARFWAEGCSPGTGLAAVRGPSRRHGSQDRTEAGPASADALGRSKPLNPLRAFSHLSPQPKCDGQALLTRVWERVNLIEGDYFGLEFQNAPSCWVRASRLAWRQAAGVHTRCRARRACEDLSGDTRRFATGASPPPEPHRGPSHGSLEGTHLPVIRARRTSSPHLSPAQEAGPAGYSS